MIEYTVGLMIVGEEIAFIRKLKPNWQEGRLNGIGGHVEPDETPEHCMVREFEEETGYRHEEWWKFAEMRYEVATENEKIVHFFWAKLDEKPELKNTTAEVIEWHQFSQTRIRRDFVPNLEYLVHLAMGLDALTKLKEQFHHE
jgi:8-oxo-dGTP diphosphatase